MVFFTHHHRVAHKQSYVYVVLEEATRPLELCHKHINAQYYIYLNTRAVELTW